MMDKGVNCVLVTTTAVVTRQKMNKWVIVSFISFIIAAVCLSLSIIFGVQLNGKKYKIFLLLN